MRNIYHCQDKNLDVLRLSVESVSMDKTNTLSIITNSNGSTRKRCEIGLKLTIETPEQRY